MLKGVKNVVLVLSGKGGVGKSTVSSQLALSLKDQGFKEEEDIRSEAVETSDGKRWTVSETRRLIALYRANENLWNTESKDYRDRAKKRATIRYIAGKLKVEPREVTRKLHILRTQFSSEVRKLERKAYEQGTECVYSSIWPYFSSLLFVANPRVANSIEQESEDKLNSETCESEVVDIEESLDDSDVNTSLPDISPASVSPKPSKKRKCKVTSDESPYVLLQQPESGEEGAFGDFVASELRQIKNPANKRKLKKIIMEAISNIAEADALGNVYEERPKTIHLIRSDNAAATNSLEESSGLSIEETITLAQMEN